MCCDVGLIDVVSGIYAHGFPLVGMTVREARVQVAGRMEIAPNAVSIVDGVAVDETAVLVAGQVLGFVIHSGEMG